VHTLGNVRYVPADSADHFVQLLHRILRDQRPVRRVTFGLKTPAGRPDEVLMHTVPRFILGLAGDHRQLHADGEETRETSLRRHEAIFFPPLGWNRPRWKGPLEFFSAVFYAEHTRFVHGKSDGRTRPRVIFDHTPAATSGACAHLVSALVVASAHAVPGPGACAMLDALLWELSRALESTRGETVGRGRRNWQAMAAFVQENLHQPLSLQMLASHFQLHPNHVSRQFRQAGQENFVDYVTRLRMKRAELLLAAGDKDIERIALTCGFADAGYFRRVFSRFFGQPPSRWRGQERTKAAGASHPK
jgi:AraC-like DNA-binding protein